MRRIRLSLLVALMLILCLAPCIAVADNTCGYFDYRVQNGGAVITGYSYEAEDYTVYIPEELDGYPVIGIASRAFYADSDCGEVYVPDCVRFIEEGAFVNEWSSISTIHLSSKTEMNPKAVDQWRAIELVIDGQLTWGGSAAVTAAPATPTPIPSDFQYTVLADGVSVRITGYSGTDRNVTIPAMIGSYQVTEIGDNAFAQQLDMKSLVIPEGVTKIGNNAFFNCVRLQSIRIPESVTEITADAFVNCVSLVDVTLPASLDTPSARQKAGLPLKTQDWPYTLNEDGATITITAYKGTDKEVAVPAAVDGYPVTAIGNAAFLGLEVTGVTLPEGVITIGVDAFRGCTALVRVTLPGTLTAIASSAFWDTKSLTSLALPENLRTIDSFAFRGSGLVSIALPDGVTQLGKYAFENCAALAQVDLGSGITSLAEGVFINCTALSSVTIPANISQIGVSAFSGSGLQSVAWAERNAAPYTIDAFAFHTCAQLTAFAPAEGLTAIGDDALLNCSALESVILPSTTTSIGIRTFAGCAKLSSVTLNEGLQQIGRSAFLSCSSLSSLEVPGTVRSIAQDAFARCGFQDAADIVLPPAINTTDTRRYAGLPVETFELAQIGKNQWELVRYNGSDTALVIPESYSGKQIVRIGEKSFRMDDELTSVTLPDTVTSIGPYAFADCERLSSVVMGKNVHSIAYNAFSNCDKLTSVTFAEDGVNVTIGQDAFAGCPKLAGVRLPDCMDDDNLARAEAGLPLVPDERLRGDWQVLYASAGSLYGTIVVHFYGDGTGAIECQLPNGNTLMIHLYTDYDEATGEIRALVANASGDHDRAFLINFSLFDMNTPSKTLHGRIEEGFLTLTDSDSDYVRCIASEDVAQLGTLYPASELLFGDWQSIPSHEGEPVLNMTFEQDGSRAIIMSLPGNSVDHFRVATFWEQQGKLFLTREATGETTTATYQLSQDGQSLSLTESGLTINLVRTTFEPSLAERLQALQESLSSAEPAQDEELPEGPYALALDTTYYAYVNNQLTYFCSRGVPMKVAICRRDMEDTHPDGALTVVVEPRGGKASYHADSQTIFAQEAGAFSLALMRGEEVLDRKQVWALELDIEDHFWSHDQAYTSIETLELLQRVDWKQEAMRLTTQIWVQDFQAERQSDGSTSVSFTCYNWFPMTVGLGVYDANGNKQDLVLIHPCWVSGNMTTSAWKTVTSIGTIFDGKTGDNPTHTAKTKIDVNIPAGGFIRVLEMQEDEAVCMVNLVDLIMKSLDTIDGLKGMLKDKIWNNFKEIKLYQREGIAFSQALVSYFSTHYDGIEGFYKFLGLPGLKVDGQNNTQINWDLVMRNFAKALTQVDRVELEALMNTAHEASFTMNLEKITFTGVNALLDVVTHGYNYYLRNGIAALYNVQGIHRLTAAMNDCLIDNASSVYIRAILAPAAGPHEEEGLTDGATFRETIRGDYLLALKKDAWAYSQTSESSKHRADKIKAGKELPIENLTAQGETLWITAELNGKMVFVPLDTKKMEIIEK